MFTLNNLKQTLARRITIFNKLLLLKKKLAWLLCLLRRVNYLVI